MKQLHLSIFLGVLSAILSWQGVLADITITPIPPSGFEQTGDMNFDYVHTSGDAQLTFLAALGLYYQYSAGDCNGDSQITAGDSGGIFWGLFNESIYAEQIPTPPAPFTPTPVPALPENIVFSESIGLSCPGDTSTFSIQINCPDYELDCLGLELHFDPDVMNYTGYEFGDLFSMWTMFDCMEYQPGIVRIAGFSYGDSIPLGSQGELIVITLESHCDDCYWEELIPYSFHWMTDDLQPFVSVPGELEVQCVRNSHNGDTNLDHQLTSGDSQMAFMGVLGLISLNFQQETTADCNGDFELTAEDAQMIFQAALGMGSCEDPV